MTTAPQVATPRRLTLIAVILGTVLATLSLGLMAPADAGTPIQLKRTDSALVVSGGRVGFAATAPGALRKRTAVLDRAVGRGRWVAVASRRVPASGRLSIQGTSAGVGTNKWRLRISTKKRQYTSTVVSTSVYGWYYLSELEQVSSNRIDEGAATIGGTRYTRSVFSSSSFWYDDHQYAEWNLGYKCRQLTTSYGLDDTSSSGSLVAFDVARDGARTELGTKGLGRATPLSLDVRGTLRVRLSLTYVAGPTGSGDTSPYGAYGNARVLCNARPAPAAW